MPSHATLTSQGQTISGLLDASDVQFEDEAAIAQALFVWTESAADLANRL